MKLYVAPILLLNLFTYIHMKKFTEHQYVKDEVWAAQWNGILCFFLLFPKFSIMKTIPTKS